jgi:voltage-gated potassium channel Kch
VLGEEILMGVGMMVVTTIIHAMFMVGGFRATEWKVSRFGHARSETKKAVLISVFTAWMFLAIVIEAWLWAVLYLVHPGITTLPDLATSFYFSMVTFTSLGYGDVVLPGKWRTLASIQAANGVIIFGWTTALIFDFIQRVYKRAG